MNDIFSDGRRHFVVPRIVTAPRRSRVSQMATGVLAGSLIISLLVGQTGVSRADASMFYPKRCTGGWQNAHLAVGEPAVKATQAPDGINRENAAVLENASAEIICDSFSGEVPPHPAPSEVVVRFSWRFDSPVGTPIPISAEQQNPPAAVDTPAASGEAPAASTEPDATIISGENFIDHVQEILDAPADKPVIFESSDTPTAEAPSAEKQEGVSGGEFQSAAPPDAEPAAPVREEGVAPSTEVSTPASEPSPVIIEPPPPVPADPPASEPSPAEGASSWLRDLLVLVAHASEEEPSAALPPSFESFLDVFYSVEEGVWRRAVSVGAGSWQDFRTTIPLRSWHDLASLKISLRVSPSLAVHPTVYLDGMSAEVANVDRNTQLSLFDLFRDRLVNQKQQNEKQVLIVQKEDGQRELWFTPVLWSRIISSESIGSDTPIEVDGENIFWFDAQKRALWRFNSSSGGYDSVSMNEGESQLVLQFTDQAGELREAVYTVIDNHIRFIGAGEIASRTPTAAGGSEESAQPVADQPQQ